MGCASLLHTHGMWNRYVYCKNGIKKHWVDVIRSCVEIVIDKETRKDYIRKNILRKEEDYVRIRKRKFIR